MKRFTRRGTYPIPVKGLTRTEDGIQPGFLGCSAHVDNLTESEDTSNCACRKRVMFSRSSMHCSSSLFCHCKCRTGSRRCCGRGLSTKLSSVKYASLVALVFLFDSPVNEVPLICHIGTSILTMSHSAPAEARFQPRRPDWSSSRCYVQGQRHNASRYNAINLELSIRKYDLPYCPEKGQKAKNKVTQEFIQRLRLRARELIGFRWICRTGCRTCRYVTTLMCQSVDLVSG